MRIEVLTSHGPGFVDLYRPRNAAGLLVLTHGAGGGVDAVDLRAIRDEAVASGIAVALVTQSYRAAGRRSPAVPAKQDESWLEIVALLRRRRGFGDLPLIVGGRSNGARVACRTAVASGASGVVALAFPLHPPGRPEKSRLDELDAAGVPTLVVQGDRDPFGMPPSDARREIVVVHGGDHSLKRDPVRLASAVLAFVTSLINSARVHV